MKVIDILSLITDESEVHVFQDGEEVASYDGKNEIPEKYNGSEVLSISTGYFRINIEI